MITSAVVVGGGLSGLAVALGLQRVGVAVRVLDPAVRQSGPGSAISLAPNGVRALDALGVGGAVRATGHRQRSVVTYRSDGRPLSRVELSEDTAVLGVRREDLHQVLRSALTDDVTRSVGAVVALEPGRGTVVLDDGEELGADLVIGADGVRSRVRAAVAPASPEPVSSGSVVVRAAVEVPAGLLDDFGLVWGRGAEFGWLRLPGGCVEWHAQQREGQDTATTLDGLVERFAGWSTPVTQLLAATAHDAVIRHGVRVLPRPLPSYVRGRAVLIGDAAHPVVPNLGQGAALGLEDAVELAAQLSAGDEIGAALARYDRTRRRRAHPVARKAARAARATLLTDRVLLGLRDAAVRHAPPSWAARSALAHQAWTPPTLLRRPS